MEYALQALTEQLELKYYGLSLLHNGVCNSCGQSRPVLWGGFVSCQHEGGTTSCSRGRRGCCLLEEEQQGASYTPGELFWQGMCSLRAVN